jgi:hypothetical protein
MPAASFASTLAVAGATTTASAQSARSMWPIRPSSPGSSRRLRTGSRVRVWSTSGETNSAAASVSTQRTAWPARSSARTSSGTL